VDESAEKDIQHTATKVRRTLRVLFDSVSSLQPDAPFVELTYGEALQYLRREALRVEAPRGMVTLRYRNLILGQGKCVGSRINNLYPEAWRIRSTYTTPFSILGIEN
jgi:NOL1/NOP2/fmu family ribosome biogenesis protein